LINFILGNVDKSKTQQCNKNINSKNVQFNNNNNNKFQIYAYGKGCKPLGELIGN